MNITITIRHVKTIEVGTNPVFLETFMNVALRNTMKKLDYAEIGRSKKFFNLGKKIQIDSEISMFPGYQANFLRGEKMQLYLRIDSAKKIVCRETVLSKINKIYS